MTRTRYTCPTCGGDRIVQDAYLWLNTDETTTYDAVLCDDCGVEITPVETEVSDEDS